LRRLLVLVTILVSKPFARLRDVGCPQLVTDDRPYTCGGGAVGPKHHRHGIGRQPDSWCQPIR